MGKAKAEFLVTGVAGPGLVSKAEEALAAINGVEYAHVNLGAGKVAVHFEDSLTSADQLVQVLVKAGFGATQI